MTKQEKVIVSAYTGVLMCDFADLHEYIEKIVLPDTFYNFFARTCSHNLCRR